MLRARMSPSARVTERSGTGLHRSGARVAPAHRPLLHANAHSTTRGLAGLQGCPFTLEEACDAWSTSTSDDCCRASGLPRPRDSSACGQAVALQLPQPEVCSGACPCTVRALPPAVAPLVPAAASAPPLPSSWPALIAGADAAGGLLQLREVYVLMFGVDLGPAYEGIYSLRTPGPDDVAHEMVVAFERRSDAERYRDLVVAAMSGPHHPSVCALPLAELTAFCAARDYSCRLEPCGSKLLPPESSVGLTDWERALRLRCGQGFTVLPEEPTISGAFAPPPPALGAAPSLAAAAALLESLLPSGDDA